MSSVSQQLATALAALGAMQRAVLPATADVERAPELARVVKVYNELAEADGFPAANHFIMTHYIDGEHSIGLPVQREKF